MERKVTTEKGKEGEDIALEFLQSKGLRLLSRNWRCGHLELDIVMEDDKMLHIVEVRSREYPVVIEPFATVDAAKRKKVIAAAAGFVKRNRIKKEVVFDVVSVVFMPQGHTVEYFPNAFAPSW
ncbi:MAG: YraN family protein [Bacteroidales bacterium]|jgi:putative endonuclease|nr:YraN family protein [Bacteroidales bacterium]MCI1732942.1 YraN family protein [Bacteroidales bacterium]